MDGENQSIFIDEGNSDATYMDTTQFVSSILGMCGMIANISFFIYFRLKGKKMQREQQMLNDNILKITQIENEVNIIKKLTKMNVQNTLQPDIVIKKGLKDNTINERQSMV